MKVLVCKESWLGSSETFIRNQVDAIKGWEVLAGGLIGEQSPLVRSGDIALYSDSQMDRLLYRTALRLGSRRLTQLLRSARPDLVHAHFASAALVIAPSARRCRIPLVVTLHGHDVTALPDVPGRRGRRYRRRLRRLFRQADLLIAVSEHIRAHAIQLGAPESKVTVHHIGVPLRDVPAIDAPRAIDVLFVGRLTPKKGLIDLIEAIGMMADPSTVRLVVAGDGPLRTEATQLARARNLRAEFLGTVDVARVQELLASSRVVAVPSRTAPSGDSEGLPTVAVEAGAAGVPVVGTRHAGIPEIVVDRETGLLVEEGDRAGIASALQELLEDEVLRSELGRGARRRVEQQFDIARQTQELERVYAVSARARRGT